MSLELIEMLVLAFQQKFVDGRWMVIFRALGIGQFMYHSAQWMAYWSIRHEHDIS